MESAIIENFPQDLLPEIMLRLPVKSLVRFKCVSKSCFSVVSDPNFAKLHFELTAPNNHQLLLKVSLNGFNKAQICSIDLEGSLNEHLANFISPIPSILVDNIRIFGVCRGFILLAYSLSSIWTPPYLVVWNPSTGVHKTLPLSPIASNFHPKYELEQVCFEYYADDDYLVIIAWIEHHSNGRLFRVNCFEVFAIRRNRWRKANTPIHWSSRKQFDFTCFGGYFHWLSIDDNAIIAFDLIERTLSWIPLPIDVFLLDHDDLTSLRLEVFKGCLCLHMPFLPTALGRYTSLMKQLLD